VSKACLACQKSHLTCDERESTLFLYPTTHAHGVQSRRVGAATYIFGMS
jgi:hypothetical protein